MVVSILRMSRAAIPTRTSQLRRALIEPDPPRAARLRYKSEPSKSTREPIKSAKEPKTPHVSTPKNLRLKPIVMKSRTQPPSRAGTPTGTPRRIKSAKKPAYSLEKVMQTEQCLSSILDGLKTGLNLTIAVSEYRKLADSKTDMIVCTTQKLFKDERVRKEVTISAVLELIVVAVTAGMLYYGTALGSQQAALRNVFFYVHQNCLQVAELVLLRVKIDVSQSIWTYSLKNLIQHKRVRRQSKGEPVQWVHEHCDIILTLIRQVVTAKGAVQQSLQNVIVRLLASVESIPYGKCKEILDLALAETRFLKVISNPDEVYTLVLDLDETLVHYVESPSGDSKVLVRPGCEDFLMRMSQAYEVVIFTAAMQDYADWVINQLDQGNWVSARLYRQHTVPSGNFFLKDLGKLGRNLARTIIIDNVAENFSLHPENGIVIRSWFDDEDDEALSQLEPLLLGDLYLEIPRRKVSDVRSALRQFREQMMQRIAQGDPNPHLHLHILD